MMVAYSGGIDSTVLLHCLVNLRNAGVINQLRAIHVHHGLSDHADEWAQHCQQVCHRWSVPLITAPVEVDQTTGFGLEQAARTARYQAFGAALKEGECLLQGHHLSDQAETLLLRLFRGTGIDGLSGILPSRPLAAGLLIRPLLSVSKSSIEAYAEQHLLTHVEDESNKDHRFSRNYIRHALLPSVETRWPEASARLAALADELSQVKVQLAASVSELLQVNVQKRPQWLLGEKPLLTLSQLSTLSLPTQRQMIRLWLQQQSLPVPSRTLLEKMFTEVIAARPDARPLLCWPGCEVRRYQGFLIASRPVVVTRPQTDLVWDYLQTPQFFHESFGCLRIKPSDTPDQGGFLLPEGPLTIKSRESIDPAMKISIAGRTGSKTLKRWLQDLTIPPWVRGTIPFIFDQNNMVAAPGLWVCSDYWVSTGERYRLEWKADCTPEL